MASAPVGLPGAKVAVASMITEPAMVPVPPSVAPAGDFDIAAAGAAAGGIVHEQDTAAYESAAVVGIAAGERPFADANFLNGGVGVRVLLANPSGERGIGVSSANAPGQHFAVGGGAAEEFGGTDAGQFGRRRAWCRSGSTVPWKSAVTLLESVMAALG